MKMRLLFRDGKVSREEAVDIVKQWLEYKMLWFDDYCSQNKYIVYQAINLIGAEEVDNIAKQIKNNWDD